MEEDYRLAASSKEPLGSIPGVQPGQTVELIAQAVNGSNQGVASEPILFTVPLAVPVVPIATASPVAKELSVEEVPVYRNGVMVTRMGMAIATATAMRGCRTFI